jgi:diphthine synthase
MSINTALEQLLEVERSRKEAAYSEDTLIVGMSRLGAPDQQIVAGPMGELLEHDFGPPLHCLVIAGACDKFLRFQWHKLVQRKGSVVVSVLVQHMQQGQTQQQQFQQV